MLTAGLGITVLADPTLSFFAAYDAVLPTGNVSDQIEAGLRIRF
jgi:fibronectin-binding autotransporter adhesin